MTQAGNRPYVLISCDAHAGADLLDYKPYLDKQFHDEFDAWAAAYQEDAWSIFDTELVDTDDPNLRIGVSSFGSVYNWDGAKRLEHMDSEGIAAEIIFPNTVPPFYPRGIINAAGPTTAEEYRLRAAGIKAHNRWLVDFCSQAPGRRIGLAQIFLNNVEDAASEVRWARQAGLPGVLIPADHTLNLVNLYERRLDPFWAACVDVGLPVTRHSIFVGPPETEETGEATDAIGLYESIPLFKRGLPHLLLGGVFERFPELRFVFTETGTDWVPEELQAMDQRCAMALVKGTHAYASMRRAVEALSRKPSEYFHANVWFGASVMTRGEIQHRHELGVDRILWGADYPHHEGSWPFTKLALRWIFSDLPESEVRAITSENAARVYDIDLDFLQTIANRIGPTPSDVATPVTAEELPPLSMCGAVAEAIGTLKASSAPANT